MFRKLSSALLLALFAAAPAIAQSGVGDIGSGGGSGAGGSLNSVAYASLPSATTAGVIYRVTNAGTKGSVWVSDGTRWKPLNGCALLATLDAVSSSIANSETVVFQYQLPANLLQLHDRLRLTSTMTKSGVLDTGRLTLRMGTTGTTSDTALYNVAILSTTNVLGAWIMDFRLESATTLLQLGSNNTSGAVPGYSTVTATAPAGAVTLAASAATNALYFDAGISSSSTNNTVSLTDAQLQLCATAN